MFQFTISAGDIAVVMAILGAVIRWEHKFSKYMVEHEILIQDYCDRKEMQITELPTRTKRPF